MLREFLRVKKRNLIGLLFLFGMLLLIKYGFTTTYLESRFKTSIDLAIWFLTPASVLWDWFDFKKNKKDK